MKEIKELEEALKETVKLLELSSLVSLALSYYHIDTDEAGLHQADIARQHLNLKGDGWELQIVSTKEAIYHKGYFPKVIWEAE